MVSVGNRGGGGGALTWTKADCDRVGCSLASDDLELVRWGRMDDGLWLFKCKGCGKRYTYDGYTFRPADRIGTKGIPGA